MSCVHADMDRRIDPTEGAPQALEAGAQRSSRGSMPARRPKGISGLLALSGIWFPSARFVESFAARHGGRGCCIKAKVGGFGTVWCPGSQVPNFF